MPGAEEGADRQQEEELDQVKDPVADQGASRLLGGQGVQREGPGLCQKQGGGGRGGGRNLRKGRVIRTYGQLFTHRLPLHMGVQDVQGQCG